MSFILKQRPTGEYWEHDSAPLWIVEYGAVLGVRRACFKAYRAIERVPAGRNPYSFDNRVLGPREGFESLEEAKEYCESHVAESE